MHAISRLHSRCPARLMICWRSLSWFPTRSHEKPFLRSSFKRRWAPIIANTPTKRAATQTNGCRKYVRERKVDGAGHRHLCSPGPAFGDPVYGPLSAGCLSAHSSTGLLICPITLVELAPAFRGDAKAARVWLESMGIATTEPWIDADTLLAHEIWHAHILRKRSGLTTKRPVADVLIGAFASRFDGIITRNPSDFLNMNPAPKVVVP